MGDAGTAETLLREALEAWAYARSSLVDEVEAVPAGRFDFRPAPESRTLAELVLHVVRSGMMMAGELSRPDGDFTRQGFEAHLREHASGVEGAVEKEELLRVLRDTHADGERRLRAAGAEHMLRPIRQFDGSHASRLGWMHHGIGHEEYHRGQVALYARMMGLVPALTRRIHGE